MGRMSLLHFHRPGAMVCDSRKLGVLSPQVRPLCIPPAPYLAHGDPGRGSAFGLTPRSKTTGVIVMSATAATHHGTSSCNRPWPRPALSASVTLLLLLVASAIHAQTPQLHFEHITLGDDLADYRAFDVAQDSIGFLWFATSEGMYRYDGLTTTVYKPRLNDTSGISSMTAWCLLTDRSGKVWLGTFDSGLDCLDPYNRRGHALHA